VKRSSDITQNAGRLIISPGDDKFGQGSTRNRALEQHGPTVMIQNLDATIAVEMEQRRK
jgi:hypothetical protein